MPNLTVYPQPDPLVSPQLATSIPPSPPPKFNFWMVLSLVLLIIISGLLVYFPGILKRRAESISPQIQAPAAESSNPPSPFTKAVAGVPPASTTTFNKIAYIKGEQVVIKNLETGELINTGIPVRWQDETAVYCQGFSWFPDGSKILAVMRPWSIYDLESKKLEPIKDYPNVPIAKFQIASDNRGIYYVKGSESGTWYFDLDSKSSRLVSPYYMVSGRSLSPNQKYIFLRKDAGTTDRFGNHEYDFLIQEIKTSETTKIIIPNEFKGAADFFDASWSPSSDRIIFTYFPEETTEEHLGVYNIGTGQSVRLVDLRYKTRTAAYSPDKAYILFEASTQELWRTDYDGNNPIKLLDKNIDFYQIPSWSPDSNKIVMEKFDYGVITVNKDGQDFKVVDKDGSCPIWSPK